jgi:hypothetical protein
MRERQQRDGTAAVIAHFDRWLAGCRLTSAHEDVIRTAVGYPTWELTVTL